MAPYPSYPSPTATVEIAYGWTVASNTLQNLTFMPSAGNHYHSDYYWPEDEKKKPLKPNQILRKFLKEDRPNIATKLLVSPRVTCKPPRKRKANSHQQRSKFTRR